MSTWLNRTFRSSGLVGPGMFLGRSREKPGSLSDRKLHVVTEGHLSLSVKDANGTRLAEAKGPASLPHGRRVVRE